MFQNVKENKNTFKKTVIICIILLSIVIFSGTASAFSGGSGTESDPYIISNQSDLQEIESFSNAYFKIQGTIEVNDTFRTVVSFTGHITGNNGIIKNLNTPLFYTISQNATIKDITFENCNINNSSNNMGILCRTINGGDVEFHNILFKNCSLITSGDSVGFLAGLVQGEPSSDSIYVKNIGIDGNCSISGGEGVGGYFGEVTIPITISNSNLNNLTITGLNNVGGAIGFCSQNLSMNVITFKGAKITANGENAGGFVGKITKSVNLEDQINVNGFNITANNNAGGYIGNYANQNATRMGINISSAGVVGSHIKTTSTVGGVAGGLIGRMCMPSDTTSNTINYTYTSSNIIETYETATAYAGGFIGLIDELSVFDTRVDCILKIGMTNVSGSTIKSGNSGIFIGGFNTYATHDIAHTNEIKFIQKQSVETITCRGLVNACGYIGAPINCLESGGVSPASNFVSTISYETSDQSIIKLSVLNSDTNVDYVLQKGVGVEINFPSGKVSYPSGYAYSDGSITNICGAVINTQNIDKTSDIISISTTAPEYVAEKYISYETIGCTLIDDPTDGLISIKNWNFGDGETVIIKNNSMARHVYTSYGVYDVSLSMTDFFGNTSSKHQDIIYRAAAIPIILSANVTPLEIEFGQPVTFTAEYDETLSPITSGGWYLLNQDTSNWELYTNQINFTDTNLPFGNLQFKLILYGNEGSDESSIFTINVKSNDIPVISNASISRTECFDGDTVNLYAEVSAPTEHPLQNVKWSMRAVGGTRWNVIENSAVVDFQPTFFADIELRFSATNDVATVYSQIFHLSIYERGTVLFKNIQITPSSKVSVGDYITLTGQYEPSESITITEAGWKSYDISTGEETTHVGETYSFTSESPTNKEFICTMYAKTNDGRSYYSYSNSIHFIIKTNINLIYEDESIGSAKIKYGSNSLTDLTITLSHFVLDGIYLDELLITKFFDNNGTSVMQNFTGYFENYKWIYAPSNNNPINLYCDGEIVLFNVKNVSVTPQYGKAGEDFTLSVSIEGASGPVICQWYKSQDKSTWELIVGMDLTITTQLTEGIWYFKCIVNDGTETKDSFNDYSTFKNINAIVEENLTTWGEILKSSTKGMTASVIISVLSALVIVGLLIIALVTGKIQNPAIVIISIGAVIIVTIVIIVISGGFDGVGIKLFKQ